MVMMFCDTVTPRDAIPYSAVNFSILKLINRRRFGVAGVTGDTKTNNLFVFLYKIHWYNVYNENNWNNEVI